METYDKWILEGYKYFAEVGPVKLTIKELSRKAGLARTSFHYYFENKDDFFDQLIEHHMDEVRKFGEMATQNKSRVTEGIIHSMQTLSTGISFHVQLFMHRELEKFNRAYLKGHQINFENGILEWFLDFFELKLSKEKEDSKKAFLLFVDVLNSRFSNLMQTKKAGISFSSLFFDVVQDFKVMLRAYCNQQS